MKSFTYTTKSGYTIESHKIYVECGDVENGPKIAGPFFKLNIIDPEGTLLHLDTEEGEDDPLFIGNNLINCALHGLQIVNEILKGDEDSLEDLLHRLYWGEI